MRELRADILKGGDVILSGVPVILSQKSGPRARPSGWRAEVSFRAGQPLAPGETYELRFDDGRSGEFAVFRISANAGMPVTVLMHGLGALRRE